MNACLPFRVRFWVKRVPCEAMLLRISSPFPLLRFSCMCLAANAYDIRQVEWIRTQKRGPHKASPHTFCTPKKGCVDSTKHCKYTNTVKQLTRLAGRITTKLFRSLNHIFSLRLGKPRGETTQNFSVHFTKKNLIFSKFFKFVPNCQKNAQIVLNFCEIVHSIAAPAIARSDPTKKLHKDESLSARH